jgi:hypothetical protein
VAFLTGPALRADLNDFRIMPAAVSSPAARTAADVDLCAECGRPIVQVPFCCLYSEGRKLLLCTAACTESFLHLDESEPGASDRSSPEYRIDIG